LIKAGLGTRVYYLEQGGYDTHGHQLPQHAALLEELSASLRAFLDDLAASRLADRVLVLVFSEFGRRVQENGSMGTDHGSAGPVFLAGSAVKPGLAGTYPSLNDLQDGDLKMTVDFRRVYATLLQDWLGLPSKEALGGAFEPLSLFRSSESRHAPPSGILLPDRRSGELNRVGRTFVQSDDSGAINDALRTRLDPP
jgi:uncharacterized protein (DUF1501 family)